MGYIGVKMGPSSKVSQAVQINRKISDDELETEELFLEVKPNTVLGQCWFYQASGDLRCSSQLKGFFVNEMGRPCTKHDIVLMWCNKDPQHLTI